MNFQTYTGWLLLAAYLSLAIEMMLSAIPSEASTLQILTGDGDYGSGHLKAARRRPVWLKLVGYLLPTALGVVLFVLPLVVVCVPALRPSMFSIVDEVPVLVVVGLVFIFAGRLITNVSVLQLRGCLQRGHQELQRGGLFRFSRNPILVGMCLFYLGNCVWLPSPLLWGGFGLYAWNMHRRVLMEEDFLSARFGADYTDYLSSVPRYVGILRLPSDPR